MTESTRIKQFEDLVADLEEQVRVLTEENTTLKKELKQYKKKRPSDDSAKKKAAEEKTEEIKQSESNDNDDDNTDPISVKTEKGKGRKKDVPIGNAKEDRSPAKEPIVKNRSLDVKPSSSLQQNTSDASPKKKKRLTIY